MGILFNRNKKKEEEEPSIRQMYLDRSIYVKTRTQKKKTSTKTAAKKAAPNDGKKKTEPTKSKTTGDRKKMTDNETAAKTEPKKKTSAPKEKKVWHITKREDENKWAVKAEGNTKATKLFNTKKEAEEYVKSLSANNEGSRVVSHKKDGKFQKK